MIKKTHDCAQGCGLVINTRSFRTLEIHIQPFADDWRSLFHPDSSDSSGSTSSSSSTMTMDLAEFARSFNEINQNVNMNNYMGELKTPAGFRYSVTDLAEKVKVKIVGR